jgi:hypothetical protein
VEHVFADKMRYGVYNRVWVAVLSENVPRETDGFPFVLIEGAVSVRVNIKRNSFTQIVEQGGEAHGLGILSAGGKIAGKKRMVKQVVTVAALLFYRTALRQIRKQQFQ